MLPAGYQQAASSVLYNTSCKYSLVLLRMGEIIVRNMLSWLKLLIKLLLLHLVGCLYYCSLLSVFFSCSNMEVWVSRKLMSVLFCIECEHGNPVSWNNLFSCLLIHIYCEYTKCAACLIRSQENPFRTVTYYLFKIHFNNMISTHKFSKHRSPCGFSTAIWYALSVPWYIKHLFCLDLVTIIIFIGSRVR